jgi:signal transduction histidine kinase
VACCVDGRRGRGAELPGVTTENRRQSQAVRRSPRRRQRAPAPHARTALADPERARGAIAAVEDTGREALGELRRLLGVLRRGDEELALAPHPSLARVEALVERIRVAGLDIELDVKGQRRPLSPGVDAAAFRVVQEALTNVVRHARASHASVQVTYDPRAVDLVVRDDGVGGGPVRDGAGILGLRERVTVYGGKLRAGRHGAGFELHARLPLGEGTAG